MKHIVVDLEMNIIRNWLQVLHIFKNETLYNQTLRKIEEVMTPKNLGNTLGSMVDFSSFVLA